MFIAYVVHQQNFFQKSGQKWNKSCTKKEKTASWKGLKNFENYKIKETKNFKTSLQKILAWFVLKKITYKDKTIIDKAIIPWKSRPSQDTNKRLNDGNKSI